MCGLGLLFPLRVLLRGIATISRTYWWAYFDRRSSSKAVLFPNSSGSLRSLKRLFIELRKGLKAKPTEITYPFVYPHFQIISSAISFSYSWHLKHHLKPWFFIQTFDELRFNVLLHALCILSARLSNCFGLTWSAGFKWLNVESVQAHF